METECLRNCGMILMDEEQELGLCAHCYEPEPILEGK